MAGTKPYVRIIPDRFSGKTDADDLFVKKMLLNYALEGKNKDGTPNGKFWINRAAALKASVDVLAGNMGWDDAKVKLHMAARFEKTWSHFDVNGTGSFDPTRMADFMRYLADDKNVPGLHT